MDVYVGEIKLFAGYFTPHNWANCGGQLLLIGDYPALFSLIGTHYGGDGASTFAIPDMRDRVPLHFGHGPGLTHRSLGDQVGADEVVLHSYHLPSHTHALQATLQPASTNSPRHALPATVAESLAFYKDEEEPYRQMSPHAIAPEGHDSPTPHSNAIPSLKVHFIIALTGLYPSHP